MSTSKLMKVTYYDPKSQIRLLCYADTVVWDTKPTPTLTALRFGGYPERVQGLADAIYGGATIEIEDGKDTYSLKTLTRQYRRELSHDGVYAEATLIAEDDGQSAKQNAGDKDEPDKDKNDEDDDQIQQDLLPRNTYIFCTPGERRELFDAVDQKTAVPMIPEYQDYVLTELQKRNILRPLQVKSLSRKLEAWLLRCEEKDKNIVAVMEDGLKSGAISIPGATVGLNPLDEINSITEYLNTFGVTVAERIKKLFVPLFDPATESLSPEVLAINQYIEDHAGYRVPAKSYYFRREHSGNHKCAACGAPLWSALNPDAWRRQKKWAKIGDYGFVYRPLVYEHFKKAGGEGQLQKLYEIQDHPDACFPARGAYRAYALSSYIKRKYKGKIYGLIVDELHEYSNKSGQGEAMAELYGTAKKVVGMTATLINGYSSGIFHLLYRICPAQMRKDNKRYENPSKFDAEYGVIQNTYVEQEPEYNSNRRTVQSKKNSRLLPGVSPLVYSRFLLDKAAFLSLTDMGKDLPEYEEIPVALKMPAAVEAEYKEIEKELKFVLKNDKKAAKKILSAYLNLLTAYPDQPYEQKPVYHPLDGHPIVTPEDTVAPGTILPKDEEVLNIVERKIAAGEKVLIYTNWTRLDSQMRLQTLLTARGWNTIIMPAKVKPAKREQWVADRLSAGLQVLIANPTLVQTGLDLNAFTTLIFYDTGYKLFTLRQASRRSWRINQTAPRVEVYMFYYRDTMQHKAIKLMASKLAVAGIIEGSFSEEGLAAMSECEDMTTLMAKELMLGIKDSVEDVSAMFKRMANLKPQAAAWSIFAEAPTAQDETVLVKKAVNEPIVEFTFGNPVPLQTPKPVIAATPVSTPMPKAAVKPHAKRKSAKAVISEDQIPLFKIA